jgi:phytoene desaturase
MSKKSNNKQQSGKPSVTIIGAGFSGLSAAGLLAKAGFEVDVFEKNAEPGGRAGVLREAGFTFDMGPSWYLFHEVFERWFQTLGSSPAEHYELIKLDPQYRVFFDDNTIEDVFQGAKRNMETFDRIEPGAGKKLREYLRDGEIKYELSVKHFLYKNADSLFDLLKNWELVKRLPTTSTFEPMSWFISRFFRSQKLRQILEYNLIFLGCSPKNAPSLFSMMAHVDMNLGVSYPMGGFGSVVSGMESVCKQHGVRFHYNSPVTALFTTGKKITTIETPSEDYAPDYILATGDYAHCESLLTDQALRTYSSGYWEKKTPGPSAFIMFLGVKGKLPKILHHSFYFSSSWEKHFADIYSQPQWPENPSIYINNPTATDPTLAPKDHEALMVLVPIAAGLEDTQELRERFAAATLHTIEERCGVKLQDRIVYQKLYCINDFARDYHSYKGNAFGGVANTFLQSSIWRPKNQSARVSNLFFAGAGTTPGIGMPTAIISGHLAVDRIVQSAAKNV